MTPTRTRRTTGSSSDLHVPEPATGPVTLLIGTRKGAFFLRGDKARRRWVLSDPILLGQIIYHALSDPRDRRILLLAAKTGHLGPTIFRSTDQGKRWKEARIPPAFPKRPDGTGSEVSHVFWLTPGHPSEPGVWFAGTSPRGSSAPRTAARRGTECAASTSTRCWRSGPPREGLRPASSPTPSSSTRGTRDTST